VKVKRNEGGLKKIKRRALTKKIEYSANSVDKLDSSILILAVKGVESAEVNPALLDSRHIAVAVGCEVHERTHTDNSNMHQ